MVQTDNRLFDNECPLHSAEGIFYKDGAEICVSNILDFEIEMFLKKNLTSGIVEG